MPEATPSPPAQVPQEGVRPLQHAGQVGAEGGAQAEQPGGAIGTLSQASSCRRRMAASWVAASAASVQAVTCSSTDGSLGQPGQALVPFMRMTKLTAGLAMVARGVGVVQVPAALRGGPGWSARSVPAQSLSTAGC
jgi:hypothetical protein